MLETICEAAPQRANEDACVIYQQANRQPRYVLAAIDGATTVINFDPLTNYLAEQRNGITPAAFAATVTRDSILNQISDTAIQSNNDPRQLVLNANNALRDVLLKTVPDVFDAEKMCQVQPDVAEILDDPRKIRLFLPSAVISLAVIDTEKGEMSFAHAGDTAILVCYADGRVEVPTHEQREINNENALSVANDQTDANRHMKDVLDDPAIRRLDLNQRIFHNYVDENGQTVRGRGIGVIDGLPELADYLKTGTVSLDGVEAILLISDGFWWPAPLHEDAMQRDARIRSMWQHIRKTGLKKYFEALRQEERADADREKYPRFKIHDDATAVLLWLTT